MASRYLAMLAALTLTLSLFPPAQALDPATLGSGGARDAPWWVDWLILRRPVKRVLKLALLGTCARHARLRYLSLYWAESLDAPRVERFIARIEGALDAWRD